jgi:hypothetical protein
MLRGISEKRIFLILRDAVLREWRRVGEGDSADWFSKVYCAVEWEGGAFNVGAAGIPMHAAQNQCSESLFRSIKRQIPERATMGHFLEVSIPGMLRHLKEQYSVRHVGFACADQVGRIRNGHVHRDCLMGACAIVEAGAQNCKQMTRIEEGKPVKYW